MPPIVPQSNAQLTLFSLTKICTGCKADKLHSEFYKNKNSLSGLCKPCHAAYSKAKYFANHEVNKAASRERVSAKYHADPEFHKEKSKQWRLNNLDKARESERASEAARKGNRKVYREANKERRKAYQKAYTTANKERILDGNREYYQKNAATICAKAKAANVAANMAAGLSKCTKCHHWLDASSFDNDLSCPEGQSFQCRQCILKQTPCYITEKQEKLSARHKAYNAARSEHNAQYRKVYYRVNHHRLILKAHARRRVYDPALDTLTGPEWKQILVDQGGLCAKCKGQFNSTFIPTRDHILPVIKGGYLTRENTQALCRGCNTSKGTKTIRY